MVYAVAGHFPIHICLTIAFFVGICWQDRGRLNEEQGQGLLLGGGRWWWVGLVGGVGSVNGEGGRWWWMGLVGGVVSVSGEDGRWWWMVTSGRGVAIRWWWWW